MSHTHCKAGHEFVPANTYYSSNRRRCRRCFHDFYKVRMSSEKQREAAVLRARAYYAANRAAVLQRQKEGKRRRRQGERRASVLVVDSRTRARVRVIDIHGWSAKSVERLEQELARTIDLDTQEVKFVVLETSPDVI